MAQSKSTTNFEGLLFQFMDRQQPGRAFDAALRGDRFVLVQRSAAFPPISFQQLHGCRLRRSSSSSDSVDLLSSLGLLVDLGIEKALRTDQSARPCSSIPSGCEHHTIPAFRPSWGRFVCRRLFHP